MTTMLWPYTFSGDVHIRTPPVGSGRAGHDADVHRAFQARRSGRCSHHRYTTLTKDRLTTFFNILLFAGLCVRCSSPAPQISGGWSGTMMLDGGDAGPAFIHVAVNVTQDGDRITGSWRSVDAKSSASGDVAGTMSNENGHQAVTMRFTFAGPHPLKSTAGVDCIGTARSEGQLTYNITSDPAHERPGWAIRLKAFEGITFESCPAIGYSTWTLTRQEPFAQ